MSSENKNRRKQFEDMQLPDMEAAWMQMKNKLQEKDNDKPAGFLFFKKFAVMGFLLLISGFAAWLFIKPVKEKQATVASTQSTGRNTTDNSTENLNSTNENNLPNNSLTSEPTKSQTVKPISVTADDNASMKHPNNSSSTVLPKKHSSIKNTDLAGAHGSRKKQSRNFSSRKKISIGQGLTQNDDLTDGNVAAVIPTKIPEVYPGEMLGIIRKNEHQLLKNASLQNDSSIFSRKLNLTTNEHLPPTTTNKKIKQLLFSAGIGLQKQLPLGNQSGFDKNYYGGNNTLPDHLPSFYARVEKNKKWFADAGFEFGAAQLLPALTYNRQTRLQDTGATLSITTLSLKKTYYHRLPFSFNYYLPKHFSVGTGVEFGILHGAISEKNTSRQNLVSGTKTEKTEIIYQKSFNDSFLYKTQVRLLFQVNYEWKRIILGLRYSSDLEPYIRFTSPAGEIKSMRSQSLQALLRFKLWQLKN